MPSSSPVSTTQVSVPSFKAAAPPRDATPPRSDVHPSTTPSQPRPTAIPGPRDESFLAEVESEARREVGLIDPPTQHQEPAAESFQSEPGEGLSSSSAAASRSNTNSEEAYEPEAERSGESLMSLLKGGKGESKKSSGLKSPRQSAAQAMQAAGEVPPDTSLMPTMAKKDTFLKQPRNRASVAPSPESTSEGASDPALSPEQQLVAAIKRGDSAWITENAQLAELAEARQEILLIYALPNPACVEALLNAGLKFTLKDGLALRAAVAKPHYGALELLCARGAQVSPDTLKRLKNYIDPSPKATVVVQTSVVQTSSEPEELTSTNRLDADFQKFLVEHGTEVSTDDRKFFSPVAEASAGISPPAVPPVPLLADPLPEAELFAEAAPELAQFLDLELPGDRDSNPLSGSVESFDLDTHPGLPPLSLENDSMSTPTAFERKPYASSTGISTADRAKLAMLEKTLQDKQRLELEVMELKMYAEAASALEEERDVLSQELAEIRDERDGLAQELEKAQSEHVSLDAKHASIEAKIAKAQAQLDAERAARFVDREAAELARAASATHLRDSERREADARTQAEALLAKVADLETREAASPTVEDWLRGSDREKALRKDMFVDAVIKGEHKHLDKLAKNTALEISTANIALAYAAEFGQVKCAQWLVETMDVHPGAGNELALLRAVEAKNKEMIGWLVERGADMHRADGFALRLAAQKDDPDLLDFLVGLGANARAGSDRALREAAASGSWRSFRALLALGCTGRDDKGFAWPEIVAREDEAKEHLDWAAEQVNLERSIDAEFRSRRGRASR